MEPSEIPWIGPGTDNSVIERARRIGDDVLEPHAAAASDPRRGVDRDHLRLLAAEGLMSVTVPTDAGGEGLGAETDFEVGEILAGACASTWFVAAQHKVAQSIAAGRVAGLPPGLVTPGPGMEVHAPDILTASTRCGVAVNHLRQTRPPAVSAERASGGYRVRGSVRWVTGWGLVDAIMVGAYLDVDTVLLFLVPCRPGSGPQRRCLTVDDGLPLTTMGGTRTVSLRFEDLMVPEVDVLCIVDGAPYRDASLARGANVAPATTGLLRRVISAMSELPHANELSRIYAERFLRLRSEAMHLMAHAPALDFVVERRALRAELSVLAINAASAMIAARGGSAFLEDSPEQRWAREAAFLLVVGQSTSIREAQLTSFAANMR